MSRWPKRRRVCRAETAPAQTHINSVREDQVKPDALNQAHDFALSSGPDDRYDITYPAPFLRMSILSRIRRLNPLIHRLRDAGPPKTAGNRSRRGAYTRGGAGASGAPERVRPPPFRPIASKERSGGSSHIALEGNLHRRSGRTGNDGQRADQLCQLFRG